MVESDFPSKILVAHYLCLSQEHSVSKIREQFHLTRLKLDNCMIWLSQYRRNIRSIHGFTLHLMGI